MKYILFITLILISPSANATISFRFNDIYGSSRNKFFTKNETKINKTIVEKNIAIKNASNKAVRKIEKMLDAPKNIIKHEKNKKFVSIYYFYKGNKKEIIKFYITDLEFYGKEEYLVRLSGSLNLKYLKIFENNNITEIDTVNSLINKIDIKINIPKMAREEGYKKIVISADFSNIKKIIRESINSKNKTRLTGMISSNIITDDFDVLKITDDSQIISGVKSNKWIIKVKPKKYGNLSFNIISNLGVNINNISTHLLIHSSEHKIKVTTSYSSLIIEFFQNNWKWLLATIIIPLIAFYGKIKRQF